MLLAVQVVVVCIFTEICLLADLAGLFEGGFGGGGGGRGLVREHFLSEDLGREWRKRGDTALEVVATWRVRKKQRRERNASRTHCQSVCMWPRCRSPERKATWQVLHVKGWVDCTEGAAWDAMVFWGRMCLCGCGGGRKRKREKRREVGWSVVRAMEIPKWVGSVGKKARPNDRASGR